ncbi:hypothetical protein [Sulfurisphaera tokodaii]|uniref:HEPN domain-containing protein n=2 Tax=Sulfurisphaera tokodaii TaxID=111955 RepID=F9VNS9_SULTO|nr:hypothetical protein [Sulfurisphaera tokodaii]BAK54437.1 hypothetical protein STK_09855 [Sulfurisphaera tokodaii str. 7]HII73971.1 hypothetical protein [Sulfurisphaera tokodaii]
MIPPKFREYARAFLNIAKKDNIRAKRALELKDYPEEFVTEEMCVQGIKYSDEVIRIAENYLRKYGII